MAGDPFGKKVLENKTKGYKNHPQLARFKAVENPQSAINQYLYGVYEEALKRGYNFNKEKFAKIFIMVDGTIEALKIIN